ncbi:unnamed protein product [Schistocephalus solidus]|uniref:Uncharacterized protein n=1 Tax=Schistocephalus solidus TaxID=70667 RepID=A0A183T2Y0_SCHSO|nr:unnamed protein product [Schistocephalus solidus]
MANPGRTSRPIIFKAESHVTRRWDDFLLKHISDVALAAPDVHSTAATFFTNSSVQNTLFFQLASNFCYSYTESGLKVIPSRIFPSISSCHDKHRGISLLDIAGLFFLYVSFNRPITYLEQAFSQRHSADSKTQ